MKDLPVWITTELLEANLGLDCFNGEDYIQSICINENGQIEDVWGDEIRKIVLGYSLEREWDDRCAFL
jgi:hypothetical protein